MENSTRAHNGDAGDLLLLVDARQLHIGGVVCDVHQRRVYHLVVHLCAEPTLSTSICASTAVPRQAKAGYLGFSQMHAVVTGPGNIPQGEITFSKYGAYAAPRMFRRRCCKQ